MIRTFADKYTKDLYLTGRSRKFPPQIVRRAIRKLDQVSAATKLDELKVPPSNRLHALERERKGQYSVSINDQWRVCFRFEGKDAYDVEVCDYH
jgi:proteic killer suppression protein